MKINEYRYRLNALFIIILFIIINLNALSQEYKWGKNIGGSVKDDVVKSIVINNRG